MQQFGYQTLASLFIQNLISSLDLPRYDCVADGDLIINGCYYIYNHNVIKCTKTGYINIESIPPLYPLDNLYPDDDLFPSDGKQSAEFEILMRYDFGKYYKGLTYRYTPNTSYYDSKTHMQLGKYLRCLDKIYNVNYMPFYNCNSNVSLNNITNFYPDKYIYTIPIKLNKYYTMSYSLQQSVDMSIIYFNDKPLFNKPKLTEDEVAIKHIKDVKDVLSGRSYENLYKFVIDCDNKYAYEREQFLYLLLRCNEKIDSLSVLEGDYQNCSNVFVSTIDDKPILTKYIDENSTPSRGPLATYRADGTADNGRFNVFGKLKLLSNEQRDNTYAFSNRLLEGLLKHTINNQEELCWNIGRVQDKLNMELNNIWTPAIQAKAFKTYMESEHDPRLCYVDISGNIDKEIEWYLFRGEI